MTGEAPAAAFADTVARLHAAMAEVANGDTAAIRALYAHTGDATSFYGWGGYEKGWEAVSRRWDWAGQQFKGGTVAYDNVTTVVTAELPVREQPAELAHELPAGERPAAQQ